MLTEGERRQVERARLWQERHPEERLCECGAVLSRYNMGARCGPCRRGDD
jgi:hypothetical protein